MRPEVDRWADRELAPWQSNDLSRNEAEAQLLAVAALDRSVCIYTIDGSQVAYHPEMAVLCPHLMREDNPLGLRAVLYRDHFAEALRAYGVEGRAVIGMQVDDLYGRPVKTPLLAFQKPRGSRAILVPDIDFLASRYYQDEDNKFLDRTSFADKQHRGMFVGSTTGNPELTQDLVARGKNARIKAAVYFRGNPRVVFDLPNIVQCDTAATVDMIRALDIQGVPRSWQEQLDSRYLLSIDGNGAACSRVMLAMLSNAVPVKYDSLHQLFYFHGLDPWRHYIPVRRNREVLNMVREAEEFGPLHAAIARQSSVFAIEHLTRVEVMRYTATLLDRYIGLFGEGQGKPDLAQRAVFVDSFSHVSELGPRWRDLTNPWSTVSQDHVVEGFTLEPNTADLDDRLWYQGIAADGSLTERCAPRQFCGSHGRGLPLFGVVIGLAEEMPPRALRVQARFADGTHSEIVPGGQVLRHDRPLSGFRLWIGDAMA